MKIFIIEENGKISSVESFKFSDCIEIEVDDDFNVMDIFNYKYEDGKLVELTPEEKEEFYPTQKDEKAMQEASLQTMITASARTSFLVELPDEQAKDIPYCYTPWGDYADGYEFTENKERVEYNGGLWKCKKTHKKQASLYPGVDPTLWEQLDKDKHKGTIGDPIPVSDSVTTSGFTYEYGLHYKDNAESQEIYLFERQSIPNPETMYRQKEVLYFKPSALVGKYCRKV